MVEISRRGLMLVISSPSGAGKTSIVKKMLKFDPRLTMSVSVTTRPKRPGEQDGVDYHFVSKEDFEGMIEKGEILEHAVVFGHYYGTPKSFVMDTLSKGQDVVFDIDWQGTQQLSHMARTDLVSIFILPPSVGDLEKRLTKRAQDSTDVVKYRMQSASEQISHWAEYDYVVVNEDLEKSTQQVLSILTAERLKRTRQNGLINFVNQLRAQSVDYSS